MGKVILDLKEEVNKIIKEELKIIQKENNMKELLTKLGRERMELTNKINNLIKFRGTVEWDKLTATHKQLLDIQLEAMKTYSEALTGRCIEILERMNREE